MLDSTCRATRLSSHRDPDVEVQAGSAGFSAWLNSLTGATHKAAVGECLARLRQRKPSKTITFSRPKKQKIDLSIQTPRSTRNGHNLFFVAFQGKLIFCSTQLPRPEKLSAPTVASSYSDYGQLLILYISSCYKNRGLCTF